MSEPTKAYRTADEIRAVVSGFEKCTTTAERFDHPAHVTVAFAYLHLFQLTVEEATARMRVGLHRFLAHYGVDGRKYNETITQFWIKLVRAALDRADVSRPSIDLANEILCECQEPTVIFSYYSRERLDSDEARNGWIEPDIKAFGF
ncbi:MAG: hypothetical protein QOJ64_2827 [Acidobacteriota bacterium]|nr:hypothetical protein [Acidobacteriota bacterium]